MQQLQFEGTWDQAISTQDRVYIEKVFAETKHLNGSGIIFSPLREAINHQEDLLVSVLVHNFTGQTLLFKNIKLVYRIGEESLAEMFFTLPKLVIPNKVSMPWTFIFPKGYYKPHMSYKNGRIEVG